MTTRLQPARLLRLSSKTVFAVLAATGAFVTSPISLFHLCLRESVVIEVFLMFVLPLAFRIAAAAPRNLCLGLAILLAAPAIGLALTHSYHHWLHTDSFPDVLLSKRAREFEREVKEAIDSSESGLRIVQEKSRSAISSREVEK
jgi:hypothetical protein